MRWPWQRAPADEKRQAGPYTDTIVRLLVARNEARPPGDGGDTGALETAAGVIARAFASARVTVAGAETDRWPPDLLASIGRDLIVRGECLLCRVGDVSVRAANWDVQGMDPDPMRWRYRIQVPAPDGHRTIMRPGSRVAHPRYSSDASHPWRGIAPLERAQTAAALAGAVELRMGEEGAANVGHLLPIPAGGDDASVEGLKSDLGNLGGKTAVVETTSAGWGEGRAAAPQSDYKPQRIGANWPPSAPPVYTASQLSVLAACGVPVELLQKADGTGQREAWRRALHGTIQPLGRMVAAELRKLAAMLPVEIDFERLAASDIAGRARAFQSLVGSGMSAADAAAAAGLMERDDG